MMHQDTRLIKNSLRFALVAALSPWLLVIFYIFNIDVVWLVNVNFVVFALYMLLNLRAVFVFRPLVVLFVSALLISFLKLILLVYRFQEFELNHINSYFFGLAMPLVSLLFAERSRGISAVEFDELMHWFAVWYLKFSLSGVVPYVILYFSGYINYFGLGVNYHYIYPFFLSYGIVPVWLFLILAIFGGKRAVLVNYFIQTIFFFLSEIKRNLSFVVFGFPVLLIFIYLVGANTDLFSRFAWVYDGSFDINDSYSSIVTAGGRFEEVFGIIEYFRNYNFDIFFGSPPGAFYWWIVDISDYQGTKNYSHITFFGYVFRYGVLFSVFLYLIFFRLVILGLGSKSPLYLVFVGIFSSSFFGANLVIDPTSWILLGFYLVRTKKRYGV